MFNLIEANNYRCLRYVKQPLSRFHILAGPNASGKTTFLDVIAFLGDFVSQDLETALFKRTEIFEDFLFRHGGNQFELAVEAPIPARFLNLVNPSDDTLAQKHTVRYEVSVALDMAANQAVVQGEKALLKPATICETRVKSFFPHLEAPPQTILTTPRPGSRTIVNKSRTGNDNFYSETSQNPGKGWSYAFNLGRTKSALGNLPDDENKFPVCSWLKKLLTEGVQSLVLNSQLMRRPSPPGRGWRFLPDGSNLPWAVDRLRRMSPDVFHRWLAHVQTTLPDLEDIQVVEREEDKHKILKIIYREGLHVPSWMASDGTLRLLALTLFAYLPDFTGALLIEEPENGIHPQAMETVFQSLANVYEAQVLLATHSPVLMSLAEPKDVLCFAKDEKGATDIVLGSKHPRLREWRKDADLGVFFASGVLG